MLLLLLMLGPLLPDLCGFDADPSGVEGGGATPSVGSRGACSDSENGRFALTTPFSWGIDSETERRFIGFIDAFEVPFELTFDPLLDVTVDVLLDVLLGPVLDPVFDRVFEPTLASTFEPTFLGLARSFESFDAPFFDAASFVTLFVTVFGAVFDALVFERPFLEALFFDGLSFEVFEGLFFKAPSFEAPLEADTFREGTTEAVGLFSCAGSCAEPCGDS